MAHDPTSSELSTSLKGQLLLASPALADGTFDRAVILLAAHCAKNGALGSIINHSSDQTVGDLLPGTEYGALRELPIHHGGPLATNELTFSAFSWNDTSGLDYEARISAEMATALMKKKSHLVHATIGYSAWSPGQLEDELVRNTWITAKPSSCLLSVPHDITLWNLLLKNISPYHNLLSQAPKNPFLN